MVDPLRPSHHIERCNIELDMMVFYFQKAPFGDVLSLNGGDDGWAMALAGSRLSFVASSTGSVVVAAVAGLPYLQPRAKTMKPVAVHRPPLSFAQLPATVTTGSALESTADSAAGSIGCLVVALVAATFVLAFGAAVVALQRQAE